MLERGGVVGWEIDFVCAMRSYTVAHIRASFFLRYDILHKLSGVLELRLV